MSKALPTPSFLKGFYELMRHEPRDIISWEDGCIHVRDPKGLEGVLGKYFRHSRFASFQRQLNYFGWRKTQGKGKDSPCTYANKQIHSKADVSSILQCKRRKVGGDKEKSTVTSNVKRVLDMDNEKEEEEEEEKSFGLSSDESLEFEEMDLWDFCSQLEEQSHASGVFDELGLYSQLQEPIHRSSSDVSSGGVCSRLEEAVPQTSSNETWTLGDLDFLESLEKGIWEEDLMTPPWGVRVVE